MKFYFVTVKYLKDRYPTKDVYESWKATLSSIGGNIIASNYEIGKTDTLHLHLVVGLEKNIFWNRLRGAPIAYHVDPKPILSDAHMGKCINYMYKHGILSDNYIQHHHEEMVWKLQPFSFV